LSIAIKPIGVVRTDATEEEIKERRWKISSTIVLRKKYWTGLRGLESYSHVFVLYWMHEARRRYGVNMTVRPKGRADMPKVGIFATRNPGRPNPVGLTAVKLLKVSRGALVVQGLDAIDGTPVIDIKPYDYYDLIKGVKVPAWFRKLWRERRRRIIGRGKEGV